MNENEAWAFPVSFSLEINIALVRLIRQCLSDMSGSNKNLSTDKHSRLGKSKSDSGRVDENRLRIDGPNDGGGGSGVGSTSTIVDEALRNVCVGGDGYRRSADNSARSQSTGTNSTMVTIDNGQENEKRRQEQNQPAAPSGNGKGSLMQKMRPYENGIEASQSVSSSSGQSSNDDSMGNRAGASEVKGQSSGTVGEDRAIPVLPLRNGTGSRLVPSTGPYQISGSSHNQTQHQLSSMDGAPRMVSAQCQRPQRQQAAQALTRPTTFVRLTRNGPFCPCFSPNDSDTEPSSPVTEMAVVPAAPTGPSRNMASLARELRARFVVGHAARAGSNAESTGFLHGHSRGRGNATDAINVVADPYPVQVHTQVEYTHYLVPDLLDITCAPYYWGVMNRYAAEHLLENQPEGTFLLRDSAQSEYLFSVSFRRFNRTLHARIEQLNHRFSFDSYDQAIFSADTVTALIEHYKDPTKFLFFEPQLSIPLKRNFVFPLQHLCRAVIASRITYNDISQLELPKKFKDYLREYHYKHPVRVTKLE